MIGSGGLVVMDEQHLYGRGGPLLYALHPKMSPAANVFLAGKAPAGCWRFWNGSWRAKRQPDDIDLLMEFGYHFRRRSVRPRKNCLQLRCQHHQIFPERVRGPYFRQKCPTKDCQKLKRSPLILKDLCRGCSKCAQALPRGCDFRDAEEPLYH